MCSLGAWCGEREHRVCASLRDECPGALACVEILDWAQDLETNEVDAMIVSVRRGQHSFPPYLPPSQQGCDVAARCQS